MVQSRDPETLPEMPRSIWKGTFVFRSYEPTASGQIRFHVHPSRDNGTNETNESKYKGLLQGLNRSLASLFHNKLVSLKSDQYSQSYSVTFLWKWKSAHEITNTLAQSTVLVTTHWVTLAHRSTCANNGLFTWNYDQHVAQWQEDKRAHDPTDEPVQHSGDNVVHKHTAVECVQQ